MAAPDPPARIRKGLPIVAYVAFGVGGLVLSVGGVLLVTLWIATQNTIELLEDKGRLLITSTVARVGQLLEPIEAQVELLAELIEGGRVDPADRQALFTALQSGLAASPHVHSVVFLDPSGWLLAVVRGDPVPTPEVDAWSHSAAGRQVMEDARSRDSADAYWGRPVYLEDAGVTVVNLRRPVIGGGRMRGLVASTITVQQLSDFVTGLETERGQNAFILYDREFVLAHTALAQAFPDLGVERPLPRVTEIGDPVLFEIWRPGWQDRRLEVDAPGHWEELGDTPYIFLHQNLAEPGDPRWIVGSYFAAEAVDIQLERLAVALAMGLAALVVAVVVALVLGRRVSRPIVKLADHAETIRSLDLEDLEPLRRSRLREIDQAAMAVNAMVRALRVFAAYVPKQIVQRLIQRGVAASLASQSREVTVLFTDIVDFTGRTEDLTAEQTAEFLNRHFELLTACIEAEEGTVDKYMGDGLMALWNALDDQPDHARRAARAALAIAAALRQDNRGLQEPVRVRIGLHSGPVVVGNIGTPSRMNYTVVGDTVNTTKRLQELAKELLPEVEVAIFVSGVTAAALPPDLRLRSRGEYHLRGRGAPIEVFALAG
jgi:class 3 adenylate cyclase